MQCFRLLYMQIVCYYTRTTVTETIWTNLWVKHSKTCRTKHVPKMHLKHQKAHVSSAACAGHDALLIDLGQITQLVVLIVSYRGHISNG